METLSKVLAALAAFDEDALAALATRGLLKRARRDLETRKPELAGEKSGRLLVKVEAETVELAVPLRDSSCSCPAGEICRHAVAAILWVMDPASGLAEKQPEVAKAAEAPLSCLAELLEIADLALEAYAGKTVFKRAARALARGLEVEYDDSIPLVVRLLGLNVTVRFLPRAGLAGSLCSCRAPQCEHRVEAVLAVQVMRGTRPPLQDDSALEASAGAPRTRDEVRLAARSLLCEMVATGFSRLSRAAGSRMTTLSMSAHGVDLPRLSRLLDTVAYEVEAVLGRQITSGTRSLMSAASRAFLLAEALARPTPVLVGEHRSPYVPVGELVLFGLGARRFTTPTGFAGLRLYFWDETSRRLAAWTDARPVDTPGFDPVLRFRAPGPWTGCPSPEAAARSRFRLSGAQRNSRGRISGREATVFSALGPSGPLALPLAIDDFSALVDRAHSLFGGFLSERRELSDIVVLKTAAVGPPAFDAVKQELVRPVIDRKGRVLRLAVRHEEETTALVDALEKSSSLSGVLGQLRLTEGQLTVQPIALYEGSSVRCPTVETSLKSRQDATRPLQKRTATTSTPAETQQDEAAESDEGEIGTPELSTVKSVIGRTLDEFEAELEGLAEGGLFCASTSTLAGLTGCLDQLGLETVAAEGRSLSSALEMARRASAAATGDAVANAAATLLRVHHIARLASEVETVRVACRGLE